MFQLEDGYTRISNGILEALIRIEIPANSLRFLLWVIRNSYGYRRKSTLPAGLREIGRQIGIGPASAHRTINSLIEGRYISRQKDGSYALLKRRLGVPSAEQSFRSRNSVGVPLTEQSVPPAEQSHKHKEERKLKERGRGVAPTPTPVPNPAGPGGEERVPESDIIKVGEAYIKAKRLPFKTEEAKIVFIKRKANFYSIKDLLIQAEGNVALAIEAIGDLSEYYGDKPWSIKWIADEDFAKWNAQREETINGKR